LKHPTSHNNHLDKLLLQEITHHIQSCTTALYIHKVRAHKDIAGNEEADKLPKLEPEVKISQLQKPTITHIQVHTGYIEQYQNNMENHSTTTTKFTYIDKWVNNKEIDLEDSNDFRDNKLIMDSQITQLLKFRTGQYMGNARKHIFYPNLFQNANYTLCHTQSIDTWPHLLLACPEPNIHKLRIK
jgi:hypothetical protein